MSTRRDQAGVLRALAARPREDSPAQKLRDAAAAGRFTKADALRRLALETKLKETAS